MVSGKKTLGDTMKEKLKSILRAVWSWRRWPYLLWLRRRVKNRRFLLIASDCNGGLLLHDLGMQFTMPTVNMAFHRFEKLCTHLDEYLAMTPVPMDAPERSYPMFTLGEAVIEGTHYKSREEFLAAWERRLQRFNACRAQGYEILLMADETSLSKNGGLAEYLAAPYRKICFTNDPAKTGKEFVYIPDRKKNGYRDSWRTVGLLGVRVFEHAMDIPAFLDHTGE